MFSRASILYRKCINVLTFLGKKFEEDEEDEYEEDRNVFLIHNQWLYEKPASSRHNRVVLFKIIPQGKRGRKQCLTLNKR